MSENYMNSFFDKLQEKNAMSEVKRYDWHPDCMVQRDDGGYVHRIDYDALAQRCRDLEFSSASFEQSAAYWKKRFDEDTTEAIDLLKSERDALRAEVERLRALLKQAVALLPREYPDEESLARQIDKEITAWNAPTTGATPEA